jgi:hypothetical protein
MTHTFKKAVLSADEKLWMTTVYKSQEFDVKATKVKLFGQIPKEFDPWKIDHRLYRSEHLTLIGIWLTDPKDEIFSAVHQVICKIKEMIFATPKMYQVSSTDLAEKLGMEESIVGRGLLLMSDLGNFTSDGMHSNGHGGYESIDFPSGCNGFDAYLYYETLDDAMEDFYTRKPKAPFNIYSLKTNFLPRNPMALMATEVKQANTAFVIMPIDPSNPELEDVYLAIEEVCKRFEIRVTRADLIEHQESITDVVLRQIRECEFLIADLSYERPNVYYEIGYAHAIAKRPILFRKKGTHLHFDLAGLGCPEFQNVTALKIMLDKRFKAILGIEAE